MLEQIKKIKAEFKELEENLNSPEMLSNPSRLADLGKRKAELEKIISLIDRLEKTEREMRENGEIINSEEDDEMKTLALEANTQLSKEKEGLDRELELELIPKDPDDNKNSIIEIRAGAGGDEAALFAGTLFKMYSRYAEKNNWSISILNSHTTGIGGYKEIVFNLTSSDSQNPVYKKMKYESGVHRVQRIPETEKSGRIHTSTATVAVLSEAEEVDIKIDPKDLRIDTFASSGPGGQSVNTTMS
ncbi:MAG: PCRF domain-containing protein, partial [Candidatus Moranbacteria bacterium]|nr:PCRF domain-containing protein [Candidatus Moranbacteria bacterium]